MRNRPLRTLAALVATLVAALSLALSVTVATPATASTAGTGSVDEKADTGRYRPADCQTLTAAQRAAQQRDGEPYVRCHAIGYSGPDGEAIARPASDGPPSTALAPSELQDAYNLPDSGEGMTVAIVDAYGYSSAEEDLAVYRSYYGLPACTSADGCFTKVDQRGGTDNPPDNGGWSVEAALDLDAVSAVCPKCKLILVQSDTASVVDMGKAVDTAVALGADVVSNSYGVDHEFSGETTLDSYYDHPGVAVVASTGDTAGGVQSWPSTSPTVAAVGGTRLARADNDRGWTETVWYTRSKGKAPGSGCSLYEPRPDYQQGVPTTCGDFKGTADISADADPATGLGVYNTVGGSGWSQWGGTSLAAPLTAGMYALAGKPTPGTSPASYPYANPDGLFDVTEGDNGTCGVPLCQARPGWDGPTGLGTPNGIQALTLGETGQVAGSVTDSRSGHALSGVKVTAKDSEDNQYSATTGDDGSYDIHLPVGTYSVTGTKFGYEPKTVDGVQVTESQRTSQDLALVKQPTRTVSGRITDASGHGWPMRAEITIDDYPGGAIYSDPVTGRYSVSLPVGRKYTMHVSPSDLPGYAGKDLTVDLTGDAGSGDDVHRDIGMPIADTCTAPGYAYKYDGVTEKFTGWQGTSAQDGWTVVDDAGTGQTWSFDNPGDRPPPDGGDADFAVVDSEHYGSDGVQDTSLVSPVMDLSGQDDPKLLADTIYVWFPDETASVDLSVDGGDTWTTALELSQATGHHLAVPLPQAAGKSNVRIRFRFTGSWSRRWELDNVFIGSRKCEPTPGGLVTGTVTDRYTGDPVVGATVTSEADDTEFGVTKATPDDADLPDGYYWLFSSHTGRTGFTGTSGRYAPTTAYADVLADSVQDRDIALRAGHLSVADDSPSVSERLGKSKTSSLELTNDGSAPIHVALDGANAGFTPMGEQHRTKPTGAPVMTVRADTSVAAMPDGAAPDAASKDTAGTRLRQEAAAGQAWTEIADYPTAVMDDAVAYHDGKVYVVGGSTGSYSLEEANVYDPKTQSWSAIARLPEALNGPSAAFVGDTLYVAGGWNSSGGASDRVYAYHPDTDTWTRVADMPHGAAMAGTAVLGNTLYVVGGCTTNHCAPYSDAVYSYDPGTDRWSVEPEYPTGVAYAACGGVDWQVVCAGGTDGSSLKETYAFTPGSEGWVQRADLPVDDWGASAASANGRLLVMGGSINDGKVITNQAFAYDPGADTWTAMPNSDNAVYRGGAACGVYKVGGSGGQFHAVPYAEALAGVDQCGDQVDWLATDPPTLDLQPGQSATVRLTMDSSVVAQPGTYRAALTVATDSPYQVAPVDVTMQVQPPRRWGKITGTVKDATGDPIAGATVAICTMYRQSSGDCGPVTYTLKTDRHGRYQLWLDKGFNPLQVIAAKAGYTPRMKVARIHQGRSTTVDFTLEEMGPFTSKKLQRYLQQHMRVHGAG